jgi:hypothetical protein
MILFVIPGHRAAMNPEAMNTGPFGDAPAQECHCRTSVFMGSGSRPASDSGMTA